MNNPITLTWEAVRFRAITLQEALWPGVRVYGVPVGGIHAAQLLPAAYMVETPADAEVYIDDLIDSGKTEILTKEKHGDKPFHVLVDKEKEGWLGRWVSFPWERMKRQDGPQDAVRRLLQHIGEDPDREGLLETPDRVVRSYQELFAGYKQDPAATMKVFTDGACDEMVVSRSIDFWSMCEHHMLPFFGKAHVGYLPNGTIIGISKLARLVDVYARRLQVQERLTTQITTALEEHLKPRGAACVLEATHLCMACRGVQKQNAVMVTSSLTGSFRSDAAVRAEFFNLIRGCK